MSVAELVVDTRRERVGSIDMYSNLSVSLQTRAGVQDLGYSATSVDSQTTQLRIPQLAT